MHLNRRGSSLFAKSLLGFIEQNWNCLCKGDGSIYGEAVSYVSHSDAQQVLKDICKSNVDKLIFGQLNINSFRNKFDKINELIKSFVDVFMISETRLDDSFPEGQFFIDGYHAPFRYDQIGNGDAFFFTSARTYQQKSSTLVFQFPTVFLLKLIFIRKNAQ